MALDVAIEEDEKLAVPGFRQAARVSFGRVGSRAAASLVLTDETGAPLPAGLDVALDGKRIGVTGNDGLVFLADGGSGAMLSVRYADGRCTAALPPQLAIGGNGLAGPLTCKRIGDEEQAR